jgi:serine phosphatase RsbU (regulator of sigma subunit)
VSKRPSHLRIHNENTQDDPRSTARVHDEISDCLAAFTAATGWAIKRSVSVCESRLKTRPPGSESIEWQLVEANPIDGLMDADDLLSLPLVGLREAEGLIGSIQKLVQRLEQSEKVIRRQEAELATSVGVSWKADDQEEMADRLESILSTSAAAIGCVAAAVYLLDETTSHLHLRSAWGLPSNRFMDPPRVLRGSLTDLEALLGNAVMLEDIAVVPEWHSPEPFGAAICVPIGTPTMPHGTLWFWSELPRNFSPGQSEIANLAAGRVMSELERALLGNEVQQSRSMTKDLESAGMMQSNRLPDAQPLHQDYEVDGWTFQDGALGGAFHDWSVTAKEMMVFGLGQALRTGPEGALVACSAQSIIRSQWQWNAPMTSLVQHLNSSLWGFEGDWRISTSLIQINPESGVGTLVSAGKNQAFVVSHRGFRMIGKQGPYLADQPDPHYEGQRFVLQPGEILLAFTGSVVELPKGLDSKYRTNAALNQDGILQAARGMLDESAADIAAHLARMLPAMVRQDRSGRDRSLIVIRNVRKAIVG